MVSLSAISLEPIAINQDKVPYPILKARNDPNSKVVVYHVDDKAGLDVASLLVAKGWENVFYLTNGIEGVVKNQPGLLVGDPSDFVTPQQLNSSTPQQLNSSTAQRLNTSTAQQLSLPTSGHHTFSRKLLAPQLSPLPGIDLTKKQQIPRQKPFQPLASSSKKPLTRQKTLSSLNTPL